MKNEQLKEKLNENQKKSEEMVVDEEKDNGEAVQDTPKAKVPGRWRLEILPIKEVEGPSGSMSAPIRGESNIYTWEEFMNPSRRRSSLARTPPKSREWKRRH